MNRRGRLPWSLVAIVTAACLAVALVGALFIHGRQSGGGFGSYQVLQIASAQGLTAVTDGFVCYDGGSVMKIGDDGAVKWSYLVGSGAGFHAGKSGTAAWLGRTLTLLDDKTGVSSFSGTMDEDVISAHMGANYTAVVLAPEHNSTVVLMENSGRRIDSITLSDVTVIDYGFFYNDSLFWVMTLDTSGTVPSCTVTTYSPGRRMVGSISDAEQVIYRVLFRSQQAGITAVGDVHVKQFGYNGVEDKTRRVLVYGWTLADYDDYGDNPLMAFVPNAQNDAGNRMRDVRLMRGTRDQTIRLPYGADAMVARGEVLYAFSSDGYVMEASLGKQRADAYALDVPFDTVYGVTDRGVAILGRGNLVYLVNLTI